MAYSDVIEKLGQIKLNNLDLIHSQIPHVKGDLTAGKDTKQPGGIPNRPYEAPKEDPNNPYVRAPKKASLTQQQMDSLNKVFPGAEGRINKFRKKQFNMGPMQIRPQGPQLPDLAQFPDEAGGNVTERGYFVDPNGDAYINTPDGLINDGEYNMDIHGLMIPLAQKMMINQQIANLSPKDFTPFNMGIRDGGGFLLPHIITPAIRDAQMKEFKRFIKNTGDSTWDLSQANSPMLIAKGKKKKKKGLTVYEEAARRDAFRDMGNTKYDPRLGELGGGFDIMDDLLDGV